MMNHIVLRNIDPWIIIPDKLNIPVRKIFTNNCSPIMAGGIVPGPVYHSHAGLLSQPSWGGEPVRLGNSLVPCLGPLVHTDHTDTVRVETNRTVGWQHLHQGGGPEPAVDIEWLIVGGVATTHFSITKTPCSPDLLDPGSIHEVRHQVPLGLVFKRDLPKHAIVMRFLPNIVTYQVHAAFPAVVSCSEPVPPPVPQHLLAAVPAEPVGLVLELQGTSLVLALGTVLGLGQANLAQEIEVKLLLGCIVMICFYCLLLGCIAMFCVYCLAVVSKKGSGCDNKIIKRPTLQHYQTWKLFDQENLTWVKGHLLLVTPGKST